MPDWKMLRESIRAIRNGGTIGDAALLKLAALGRPSRDIDGLLEPVRGYAPQVDIDELRMLPAGSFGREYARHLDANGIEPFVFSPEVEARMARENPFALRYTVTHDMHHALTGFDTGLAGEAGVFAFTVGQGTAPGGGRLLWFQRLMYTVLSPTQARQTWHNVRVGLAMGQRAQVLPAQRLESLFEWPIEDVRARLGLPDPVEAGVLPSGRSLLVWALYPALTKTSAPAMAATTAVRPVEASS